MRAGTLFHQEDQFKDPELDIEHIGRYRLCYALMQDGVVAAAFDTKTKACLLFEHYRATRSLHTLSAAELVVALEELVKGHHLFAAGYWRDIVWLPIHERFVLVPQPFFRSETAEHYLRLNTGKPLPESQPQHFDCLSGAYTCVFEQPEAITRFFREQYRNSRLIWAHGTGTFLEGIFHQQEAQLHELNLLMHGNYLTVLNLNAKNLRFLNTFPVNTPEDVLYFTLSTAEALEIPFSALEIRLFGKISTDSASLELLKRYVKSVTFGKRPQAIQFSGAFNAFARFDAHRYFTLFSTCLLTP